MFFFKTTMAYAMRRYYSEEKGELLKFVWVFQIYIQTAKWRQEDTIVFLIQISTKHFSHFTSQLKSSIHRCCQLKASYWTDTLQVSSMVFSYKEVAYSTSYTKHFCFFHLWKWLSQARPQKYRFALLSFSFKWKYQVKMLFLINYCSCFQADNLTASL